MLLCVTRICLRFYLNVNHVSLRSMGGTELWFHQLLIGGLKMNGGLGFRMTWGWVMTEFVFGRTSWMIDFFYASFLLVIYFLRRPCYLTLLFQSSWKSLLCRRTHLFQKKAGKVSKRFQNEQSIFHLDWRLLYLAESSDSVEKCLSVGRMRNQFNKAFF